MRACGTPTLKRGRLALVEDSTVLRWHAHEHSICWQLFQRCGPRWERDGEGFLKWDGCHNFRFGDDNGYAHTCRLDENDNSLARIERAIVALAEQHMPAWDFIAPDAHADS